MFFCLEDRRVGPLHYGGNGGFCQVRTDATSALQAPPLTTRERSQAPGGARPIESRFRDEHPERKDGCASRIRT